MKRFLVYISIVLVLLLCGSSEIQALAIMDTTPAWDGSSVVTAFGYSTIATFGQVITVPQTDWMLTSFTFYMNLPVTCTFRGFVYAWDGSKATGPALYESAPRTTSGTGTLEEITFEFGGLELTRNAAYVLFASTSKDDGSDDGSWGQPQFQDVYPGGDNGFVFLNNSSDESLWTVDNWTKNSMGGGGDLAFKATFVKPARRILYWNDSGTDYMGEALANVSKTYPVSVITAADETDFKRKMKSGGWDLVVLMTQGNGHSTQYFNSYVSGGGRAILADSSKNSKTGARFGVSYSGNQNQTSITMTDDLLSAGVTNPMSLTNPGWGMEMTERGIVGATFPDGDAAIVIGNKGKTIINGFLSDTPSFASDGVALFENEIETVLPLTVTSPNGGEGLPTGGIFHICWTPSRAVSFDIDISTNNGVTWSPLQTDYRDTTFEWQVPPQKKNMKDCRIRVTGYDAYDKRVGRDISDRTFTIEVVKLKVPNGLETWDSGSPHKIVWSTNNTLKDVTSVELYYTLNGGKTWKLIDLDPPLEGNPGSASWRVPSVKSNKSKCRVMVVLRASDGTSVGSDMSDYDFRIEGSTSLAGITVRNEMGDTSTTSQP